MFFGLFDIIFPLVFAAVAVVIVVQLVKGLQEWNHNNHSPVLEVEAGVVAKRADVSHTMHQTGEDMNMHSTTSTSYYITFQVHSGDRMEFHVSGEQYGMIAEGDFGMLTFQGSRFLKFQRT